MLLSDGTYEDIQAARLHLDTETIATFAALSTRRDQGKRRGEFAHAARELISSKRRISPQELQTMLTAPLWRSVRP